MKATPKWFTQLPILMQESFWWQCGIGYNCSANLPPPGILICGSTSPETTWRETSPPLTKWISSCVWMSVSAQSSWFGAVHQTSCAIECVNTRVCVPVHAGKMSLLWMRMSSVVFILNLFWFKGVSSFSIISRAQGFAEFALVINICCYITSCMSYLYENKWLEIPAIAKREINVSSFVPVAYCCEHF